jgi:putative ABC transport system ATP-binding protein
MTVLSITHKSAITRMADRVIKIKNGTIESIEENRNIAAASEIEW